MLRKTSLATAIFFKRLSLSLSLSLSNSVFSSPLLFSSRSSLYTYLSNLSLSLRNVKRSLFPLMSMITPPTPLLPSVNNDTFFLRVFVSWIKSIPILLLTRIILLVPATKPPKKKQKKRKKKGIGVSRKLINNSYQLHCIDMLMNVYISS